MKTTTITSAVAAIVVSLIAAGCGTSDTGTDDAAPTPPTASAATTNPVERPTKVVDQLVTVGSGRMHIRCAGHGDTTVLLIAGWGEGTESWTAIEPTLAGSTRACAYARFGTGTSDAPATTQTFETHASDLHAMLEAVGETGPYVVVGHSFGGAEAVTFTSRYPDLVAGLMLIDASPAGWPTTACSVPAWGPLCAVFHDPSLNAERLDVVRSFDAVAAISSLGDLPMAVMARAHFTDPALEPAELTRVEAAWVEGADRWAALSSDSTVVFVEDTGHHIQLDQPARVIDEVGTLLARAAELVSARSGSMGQ